jgi:hypothetical protein
MGGVCVAFTLACLFAAYSHHRKEQRAELEARRRAEVEAQQRADLEARLKEMAPLLKSNSNDRPFQATGLHLEREFWVDEKRSRETSVRQALIDLGASLQDGKVVDPDGRELYFLRMWRPESPRDRAETAQEAMQGLKERGFRVIPMYDHMPKD